MRVLKTWVNYTQAADTVFQIWSLTCQKQTRGNLLQSDWLSLAAEWVYKTVLSAILSIQGLNGLLFCVAPCSMLLVTAKNCIFFIVFCNDFETNDNLYSRDHLHIKLRNLLLT